MCGLAHFFEEEGVATTSIALIREHAEAIRAPRALWVPFDMGRPFGAPNEPAFQRRVLSAALALLDSKAGPVVLADFGEDAPGPQAEDGAGWVCPVSFAPPPGGDAQTRCSATRISAAATNWPSTSARHINLARLRRCISHSACSIKRSPGTTWRLKRALSVPTNR